MHDNPVVNELLDDRRFVCLVRPKQVAGYEKFLKYRATFAPIPQPTEDPVYVSVIWSNLSYDEGYVYCDDSSVEIAVMHHEDIISGDVKGWVKSADEVLEFYNETVSPPQ